MKSLLLVIMIRSLLVTALLSGSAQAFAPVPANRALRRAVPAYAEANLVPVNDDNVKASVGITGFAAGFVFGGPVTGAVGSALANYISNKVNLGHRDTLCCRHVEAGLTSVVDVCLLLLCFRRGKLVMPHRLLAKRCSCCTTFCSKPTPSSR